MKKLLSVMAVAGGLMMSGVSMAETKPVAVPAKTSAPAKAVRGVNVNTADAPTLANALFGVGPEKAKAIVEWRKKNGAFSSLAQLEQVNGIGPATIEKNRHLIVFR